ncbi:MULTISPECIES: hypothetical protein [Micrococcaceae]|uniref:hypothetical protein n=1 Tax=unclassified Kocuria TaxID=2649579 RepID=UPI001012C023|nr:MULTISPECIES: hypothetical protein [unclassified Kocuria]
MMLTLLLMGASLVFALLFASRPLILLSAPILVRLFLPAYQASEWFNGLHPAGYMVMASALVQTIFYWPRVKKVLRSSYLEIAVFLLFCALIMANVLSIFNSFTGSLINIAVVYLPPFVLYLMFKMVIFRSGFEGLRKVAWAMHLAMLVQMYLAIQQNITGHIIVFEETAKSALWQLQGIDEIGRSQGFVETGLDFTALCAFMVALTYFIRNPILRWAFIGLYLYGALLGNGRASMLAAVITAVAVILAGKDRILTKLVGLVLMVGTFVWMLGTEVGQALTTKIEDDGGSSELRKQAYVWAESHWHLFTFTGYPGNRDFRGSGVLGSSLENAYLIVGADYGLITAAVLLVLQIFLAVRNMRNAAGVVMVLGALDMIANNLTNSGFTSNQVGAYLTWIALGFATIGKHYTDYGYAGPRPGFFSGRRKARSAPGDAVMERIPSHRALAVGKPGHA